MAYHEIFFSSAEDEKTLFSEDEKTVVMEDHIKLRSLDSGNNYAPIPFGKFFAGNLEIAKWSPRELKSLFSFEVGCTLNDGDILFQISLNDGVSYLRWDGLSWVVATTVFNSVTETNAGIPFLPIQDSLKIKVRLEPNANSKKTPKLYFIRIGCDFSEFAMSDDIFKSLKKRLESCRYLCHHRAALNNANSLLVPDKYKVLDDSEVFVFDVENDPNFRDNLLSSFSGQSVILSTSVTSLVEVRFTSFPTVHISTDVIKESLLPGVTLQFLDVKQEQAFSRSPDYELDENNDIFRKAEIEKRYRVTMELKVFDHIKRKAIGISDAIRRFFEKNRVLKSIAMDRNFEVIISTALESQEDRPVDNLLCNRYEIQVSWVDWNAQPDYEEINVAHDVVVNVRTLGDEPNE